MKALIFFKALENVLLLAIQKMTEVFRRKKSVKICENLDIFQKLSRIVTIQRSDNS